MKPRIEGFYVVDVLHPVAWHMHMCLHALMQECPDDRPIHFTANDHKCDIYTGGPIIRYMARWYANRVGQ